jgi:hypothetical protein
MNKEPVEAVMPKLYSMTVGAALVLSVGACVNIDDDRAMDADELPRLADKAVQICGQGNVKEVSAEGFTCKDPDK